MAVSAGPRFGRAPGRPKPAEHPPGGWRRTQSIEDFADRPTASQLQAEYDAAVAASATTGDHIRTTTRAFDAQGNQLRQTEVSLALGAVSSRAAFDRYNNKTLDVAAAGIAGLENTMRMAYDGMDHLVRSETGPFEHFDEANLKVTGSVAQTYGYDARGNQTTATDARGFTTRMRYDTFGRMTRQWDGIRGAVGTTPEYRATLRTDHEYDAFDRRVAMVANDLSGSAAHATERTAFDWTSFDQLASYTDALTHKVSRTCDAGGNQTSEQDARGNTEYFTYDQENRVIARTDRLGHVSTTVYDAYGQRRSETDANGRTTEWLLGAFGQTLGISTYFGAAGYAGLQGAASSHEDQLHDWIGRLTQSTDSFGKSMAYGYNDADEQIRIADRALDKAVAYTYDALGRRTTESLTKAGLVQRSQTNTYNNQGWLSDVQASASYTAATGTTLTQSLHAAYQFDAAGNRVRVRTEGDTGAAASGLYTYDASNRMTSGRDDKLQTPEKPDQTINELAYDGYGNRLSETRDGTVTTYAYDELNRVVSSSAGETWAYDANGNATAQHTRDNATVATTYNAENRATVTVTTGADGKTSTSTNTSDALGNIMRTRVDGDGYGFTETTGRDLRYLEQSKTIGQSWAKGAAGLSGATSFTYDQNGNLAYLDRGAKQTGGTSVASFDYDLEGQIIGRADTATTQTSAVFFTGYAQDPDAQVQVDETYGTQTSVADQVRLSLFGGATGTSSRLQSYLYANNKAIAEADGSQSIALKKLRLTGGEAVLDTAGTVTGWQLTFAASDIEPASGPVDRNATARKIAALHYAGFTDLSGAAQDNVVAYVLAQLPPDGQITAGHKVTLHGFILMADASYSVTSQITDYSVRQIGDGTPGGSVQTHVVRAGDTLQSIAALYFGSPSYWYLIADANGLTGTEPLAEGTTITVPNKVTNSANTSETFKVYNESEIIGSTSPELRTIKKKKSFWQKLVMVIIVVVMIVAAFFTGGAALAAYGAVLAATGSVVVAGVAAMAAGAAIMAGVSIATQGLAMASGLQQDFSWKQVGRAALGGAFAGAAAAVGAYFSGIDSAASASAAINSTTTTVQTAQTVTNAAQAVNWVQVATQVGLEATRQLVMDGKITSYTGLVGSAIQGGALNSFGDASSTLGQAAKWVSDNKAVATAGLGMVENYARGRANNVMNWVGLATAAMSQNSSVGNSVTTDAGTLNWRYVAMQTVGALIVGDHMGEDAGLNYLGNAIGNGITDRMQREEAISKADEGLAKGNQALYRNGFTEQQRRELAILAVDGRNRELGAGLAAVGSAVGAQPQPQQDVLGDFIQKNEPAWEGRRLGTADDGSALGGARASNLTFSEDVALRKAEIDPYGFSTFPIVSSGTPGVTEFDVEVAQRRATEIGKKPVYDFGDPLEGGEVGDRFAGGNVRVLRGSGVPARGSSGVDVLDSVPSTVNGVSVNTKADALIRAGMDIAGAGDLYREIRFLGALMNDGMQQSTLDKLKGTLQERMGMMRILPSASDLGAAPGIGSDGVVRWDKADLIERYSDALRKVELMKQGVVEINTRTMMITSVGTERLAPEQWVAENTRRYQAAFAAGVEDGQRRYAAGTLRYPLDMPEQLQIGSFADNTARQAVIEYNRSIGVPEGPGQLLSMNRWSYDPSGSGNYNRVDLLMDLGPNRNAGALTLRTAIEGKTSLHSVGSSSGQLQRVYNWVTPNVVTVTPQGALPWAPKRGR